jgi:aryl carrier-like protein
LETSGGAQPCAASIGSWGWYCAPPRTALEEEIASVWRQALDVTLVGIEDNFFELGGDSLQCLVVVSRLAERGIRVTPKAFYANATIAGLASVAEQVERPTAVVDQTVRSGPVPLVPIQRFFLELDLEAAHHWNVTALLRADRLDAGAVERALQAILDHHDALRLRLTLVPEDAAADAEWRLEVMPRGSVAAEDCLRQIDVAGVDDAALRACARIAASDVSATSSPGRSSSRRSVTTARWISQSSATQARRRTVSSARESNASCSARSASKSSRSPSSTCGLARKCRLRWLRAALRTIVTS